MMFLTLSCHLSRAYFYLGFAKKTFISYDQTFKENFKQGKVSDIDLEGQNVIMENGEVNIILLIMEFVRNIFEC